MARRKTWREKLADSKDLPRVVPVDERMSRRWGDGTVAIPAPREVDALMSRVPSGRLVTINELREALARQHGADLACPITTGIFAWIAAHAADEAERAGQKKVTPYWRILKSTGELNPKYPGGVTNLASRLRAEGHRVVQKGKRYLVANFADALAALSAPALRRSSAART
jgi:hypothetical protein